MKPTLRQQGQMAALKCGAAAIAMITCITLGMTALAYQSPAGVTACWFGFLAALLTASHYGHKSIALLDKSFDEEMRELTGRSRL